MEIWSKNYHRMLGPSELFQNIRSALMLLAGALGMPNHFRSAALHRSIAYW
jgi:hypothetical protein